MGPDFKMSFICSLLHSRVVLVSSIAPLVIDLEIPGPLKQTELTVGTISETEE